MKRFPRIAFTLVEMIVVVAIILLLIAIAIPIAAYVNNKGARSRAQGEIAQMSAALASYQTDFGSFPQDVATAAIDPRVDFDPIGGASAPRYRAACLTLYSALSGDYLPAGMPDGKPEKNAYIAFPPNRVKTTSLGGGAQVVNYLQDPFSNCYGYSTAGLAQETQYQIDSKSDPATSRPNPPHGYNPTFDLWSTSGQTTNVGTNKWEKNWPD